MKHYWKLIVCGTALSALAVFSLYCLGEDKKPRPDRSKSEIEVPIKSIIATSNQTEVQHAKPDPTKSFIEVPIKEVIASNTISEFKNPKVDPGNVQWHKDLSTAHAASRKSSKPILLFHMMGNLDQQFC